MLASTSSRSRMLAVWLVGATALSWPVAGFADFNFQARYLTGEAVPGAEDSAIFEFLTAPTLSPAGDLMFASIVRGADGVSEEAIIAPVDGPGSALGVAARVGDTAPGVSDGAVLDNLSEPAFNGSGQVAYYATLRPDENAPLDLLFWNRDSALFGPVNGLGSAVGLLAREGSPAPDVTDNSRFDNLYSNVGGPGLDDWGGVHFEAPLKTGNTPGAPFVSPQNKFAVFGPRDDFVGPNGVVIRQGDLAPGLADGSVFRTLLSDPPRLNGKGMSVVRVILDNGSDTRNAFYRIADAASEPELILRTGDPVLGAAEGIQYGTIFPPAVNTAGDIAFSGILRGDGSSPDQVDILSDAALIGPSVGTGSPVGLIFREGDFAPGANGAIFSSFTSEFLSSNGDLAFSARVRQGDRPETSERALFAPVAGPGSPHRLIAREGDRVPSVTDGAVFNGFLTAVLNAEGVLVFEASLVAGGGSGAGPVGAGNNTALLAYHDGELSLLARAGEDFEVAGTGLLGSETRTISRVSRVISGGADQDRVGFTDDGLLGFQLSFTDGSQGIFTVDLTPIPEPGTAAIGLMGLMGLAAASRPAG